MSKEPKSKQAATNCDFCFYYREDEDTGISMCSMALDEDEMLYYLKGKFQNCTMNTALSKNKCSFQNIRPTA